MQTIIVSVIILAALLYVGIQIAGKVKSFTPKGGCGSDCGCESSPKASKF
ncbi:MAG: hypothetical protein JWN60_3232 [Acidobacteria bacterium]|jgi:hypothetical protein|nr:hypothetical protein [Acidobacteriota bacterium]